MRESLKACTGRSRREIEALRKARCQVLREPRGQQVRGGRVPARA